MAPQISVLISTYNNRRFVAKKLAEIRRQTIFDRAEFLFIETGSPERERELIAPFCAEHPNCRLLTTEDRRTLYAAWNLGWDAARAPLLCYTNMDDAMHPALLEHLVKVMEEKPWDACPTALRLIRLRSSGQCDLPHLRRAAAGDPATGGVLIDTAHRIQTVRLEQRLPFGMNDHLIRAEHRRAR